MELIKYYTIFALSISISSWYLWFWPLIKEAKDKNIINGFTKYPILSSTIYILLSAVVAPMLVLPMFNEDMAEGFKSGLRKEISKAD